MTIDGWEVASAVSGVIYFTFWSVSFYPQLILNHKRRRCVLPYPVHELIPARSAWPPTS